MSRTPFSKAVLKKISDNQSDKKERVVLTHGTSVFNFIYSLSEGGKPATSLALGKIVDPKNEPDTDKLFAFDESLKKFGDIIVTLSPTSIFNNNLSIYTRDSYTRDAPQKVAINLSKEGLSKLRESMLKYIELTGSDKLKTIEMDFKADREMSFMTICNHLKNDPAFMMSFLENNGVDLSIPTVAPSSLSPLGEYLSKELPKKLIQNGRDELTDSEKSMALAKYDEYYQQCLDAAQQKFKQNMYRSFLDKSDEIRLSAALVQIESITNAYHDAPLGVDIIELAKLARLKVDEVGGGAFDAYVIATANQIGGDFFYYCDDESFDNKEEAWEYMLANSGMQSQQSLVYSQNEIFSLKAKELRPEEVYDCLDMIEPLKFAMSSDAASSDYDSYKTQVAKFGEIYKALQENIGVQSTTSAYRKKALLDLVSDTSRAPDLNSLTDIGFNISGEKEDIVRKQLNELRSVTSLLLPDEIDMIQLNNAYHHIRNLKRDLDFALDVTKLTFDDSREFYKESLPLLVNTPYGGCFDIDSVMEIRQKYEFTEALASRRDEIEYLVESLSKAFDELPDEVPYFELVTNYTLQLDSEEILSIHIPSELKSAIHELSGDYPFLKEKVTFYDKGVVGELTQSVINSGASVEAISLSHKEQRDLKLNM